MKELNSIPGLVLGTTVALIVTFWVLNLIHTNRYVPGAVQNLAGGIGSRASGSAYGF